MDDVLKLNGAFLCYTTFVFYSCYLYPLMASWNLILLVFLVWIAFFVYDINRDIIFKRESINEKSEPKPIRAGDTTWQVV